MSGSLALSAGVNRADGAKSRGFVGSYPRCALLILGFSSMIRATIALTAAVSFQSIGIAVSFSAVTACDSGRLFWLFCRFVPAELPTNPQLLTELQGGADRHH